jgi:hypothetical protein
MQAHARERTFPQRFSQLWKTDTFACWFGPPKFSLLFWMRVPTLDSNSAKQFRSTTREKVTQGVGACNKKNQIYSLGQIREICRNHEAFKPMRRESIDEKRRKKPCKKRKKTA